MIYKLLDNPAVSKEDLISLIMETLSKANGPTYAADANAIHYLGDEAVKLGIIKVEDKYDQYLIKQLELIP